jgi:hypothetical protein
MTTKPIAFRGHNSKIGSLNRDAKKLMFFVGYHECANCDITNKIYVDSDDVRALFNKHGYSGKKPDTFGVKFTKKLVKHYNLS